MRVAWRILAATLVLPAVALAQTGEFVRPAANMTTEAAWCGRGWVSLSLESTRDGVRAVHVDLPGGDESALAKAVTSALTDMKVVSTIRIYCGGETFAFEINGYTAWSGDAAHPLAKHFTLSSAGLRSSN